jgi:hypothetical protein
MPEQIDYESFGPLFVEQVVTPERVRETVVLGAAGEMKTSIKLAGGLVAADGGGSVERVDVERLGSDPLVYRATIHAGLQLTVRIARIPHRFAGTLAVPLTIRAVTRDDLCIEVHIADVAPTDIELRLEPMGRAAGVVEQIGQVSEQVRREIAKLVTERLADPALEPFKFIELGPAIDAEWERRTKPGP